MGNENRIKIIKMLYPQKSMTVTEVKRKLGISYKWMSKNLVDLEKIGILLSKGLKGHVIYRINPDLSKEIDKVIRTFTS